MWGAAPGPGHGRTGILYEIRVIVGCVIPGPGYTGTRSASLNYNGSFIGCSMIPHVDLGMHSLVSGFAPPSSPLLLRPTRVPLLASGRPRQPPPIPAIPYSGKRYIVKRYIVIRNPPKGVLAVTQRTFLSWTTLIDAIFELFSSS